MAVTDIIKETPGTLHQHNMHPTELVAHAGWIDYGNRTGQLEPEYAVASNNIYDDLTEHAGND